MRMNTDALVLKISDSGENDRIVTLLTRDYGVIRAFANGSKKVKNPLHSKTQSLCYCNFSIYKSRDSYVIDEAKDIELFFGLRDNIGKISLAQYFCELEMELVQEMEESDPHLRIILNALHLLEKEKRSEELLKAAFEIKLLCLAGYMPSVYGCSRCGREESDCWYFSPAQGEVTCSSCSGNGIRITPGVKTAMDFICNASPEKIYNFALPESQLKILADCSERYVAAQTHANYKSLAFYKSVNDAVI